MKQEILHNEILKLAQTTKQWVISIVLLLGFIYATMSFYLISVDELYTKDFKKDDFIAISIVLFLVIMFVLIVLFLKEVKIVIFENSIVLKQKWMNTVSLDKNGIKSYRNIDKKEYFELIKAYRKVKSRKKIGQQFSINIPNFVLTLKNGEKIFVQSKRKASFVYSMNKMLNLRYD